MAQSCDQEGMSSALPVLSAESVGLVRGARVILRDVSVAVYPGEIVTLIGPNGAGKTTLVRVLLGLVRPTQGRVLRRGHRPVGYVPQRLRIDPTMPLTVERFLKLRTRTDAPARERVLREVGLARRGRQSVHELSGGELQRLLLARALLRRPRLLVLDEPAQGVDVAGQAEVYGLIAALRDRYRCAVLMVSHDLDRVLAATDRVYCLNQHVCCSGAPDAVSDDPAYHRLFTPQTRHYTHHHDHRHRLDGEPELEPGSEPDPNRDARPGAASEPTVRR